MQRHSSEQDTKKVFSHLSTKRLHNSLAICMLDYQLRGQGFKSPPLQKVVSIPEHSTCSKPASENYTQVIPLPKHLINTINKTKWSYNAGLLNWPITCFDPINNQPITCWAQLSTSQSHAVAQLSTTQSHVRPN